MLPLLECVWDLLKYWFSYWEGSKDPNRFYFHHSTWPIANVELGLKKTSKSTVRSAEFKIKRCRYVSKSGKITAHCLNSFKKKTKTVILMCLFYYICHKTCKITQQQFKKQRPMASIQTILHWKRITQKSKQKQHTSSTILRFAIFVV